MSRTTIRLREGAKVLVDTKNIRLLVQAKTKDARRMKLLPRYMRPFEVEKKVNDVAYRVDFRSILKYTMCSIYAYYIHTRQADGYSLPPPPLEIDGEWEYEVEQILNERIV